MASPNTQLEYAPPVQWRRRKALHLWLVGAAGVVVMLAGFYWGPPAWRHLQMLYWQRQCMSHTEPADLVVFSAGLESPHVPEPWRELYRLLSPPGHRSNGTLFLHRRRAAGGKDRLVAVDLTLADLRLHARIVRPGSIFTRPAQLTSSHHATPFDPGQANTLRFSAGQADPADPSHFTIEYEVDGARGIIDGWLMPDDTILLEPRRMRQRERP